jgi:ketosteroid isomerase-like protein
MNGGFTMTSRSTTTTGNNTAAWISRYYELCGAKDIDAAMEYWAPDGELRFANEAPLTGREAIRETFKGFVDTWAKETHTLLQLWELPNDVVIFELGVEFRLHDGEHVRVQGMAYNRVQGERFLEQRTYVDMSPVWAAAAASAPPAEAAE